RLLLCINICKHYNITVIILTSLFYYGQRYKNLIYLKKRKKEKKKKMLNDLFRRLRQKEPTRILVLRRLVIFVSLSLLIIFFAILCIGMYEELPSIKTTLRTVDNLP